jgi:hypothetical protein
MAWWGDVLACTGTVCGGFPLSLRPRWRGARAHAHDAGPMKRRCAGTCRRRTQVRSGPRVGKGSPVITGGRRGQGRASGQWGHTRGTGEGTRATQRDARVLSFSPPRSLPVVPSSASACLSPLSPACCGPLAAARLLGWAHAGAFVAFPSTMQRNALEPSHCIGPNLLVSSSSFSRSPCLFWLHTREFSPTERNCAGGRIVCRSLLRH